MRYYMVLITTCVFFASCLKQSIPDAMLSDKHRNTGGVTAMLSYEIKGIPVQISVPDAGSQNPLYATLSCIKYPGFYSLSGLSSTGEITFTFYTDTLTLGNYTYNGSYGEEFFMSFYNENQYTVITTDYLTFSVTSYENGCISGSFSGQLTPMINNGNNGFIHGDYGSTKITNGVFQNIPVFY